MRTKSAGPGVCAAMTAATPRNRPGAVIGVVALMQLAIATPLAHGNSSGEEPNAVPLGELKRAYLACSDTAVDGRMSSGSIMQCSMVYEALKRRAFGGDFEKLLAWSRDQSAAGTTDQRGGAREADSVQ